MSAHRLAITRYLPRAIHDSDYPFNPSTTCRKVGRWRITDLSLTLYTCLSLSTVYRKFIDANTDLYRTPYPPISRYGPVNRFYGPLRRPPTPPRTTTDLLRPLTDTLTLLRTTTDLLRPLTETSYPPINLYGPISRSYGPYKTSATRYVLHYTIHYGRH